MKRTISVVLMTLGWVLGAQAALVGHWKMGEGASWDGANWLVPDETAGPVDGASSGLGEPARVEGVNLAGDTPPRYAMDFQADGYVGLGNPAKLDLTGSLTVSAWIQAGTSGGHQPIAGKGDEQYMLRRNSDWVHFFTHDGGGWHQVNAAGALVPGQWHHVVGRVDGTAGLVSVWVDGIKYGEASGGITSSTADVEIGRNSDVTDRLYDGVIDEVRIYDHALTDAEIQAEAGQRIILQQPSISPSDTVWAGTPVDVTVDADGVSLTYQWFKDASRIAGATNDTLSIAAAAVTDSGAYHVVATNEYGFETSDAVTLTVNPASSPTFARDPQSVTRYLTGSAVLSVAVDGTPPIILQWAKDSVAIPDATNDTLTITDITPGDAGHYTAMAANAQGSATSTVATLTLRIPAAASYEEGVVSFGPVGYWRMDEANGSTTAFEYMNGHDAVHNAGVTAGNAGPRPTDFDGMEADNKTVTYNGVDGGSTTDESLMSNLSQFTMMSFINPVVLSNDNNRIGFIGQNDVSEFGIHGDDFAIWTPGSGTVGTDKGHLPLNAWSHIACVGDGTNVYFYLNGVELVSDSHSITTNYGASTDPFNIGHAILDASGNFFEGAIDEVALYDRALRRSEVNAIYNLSLGQVAPIITIPADDAEVVLGDLDVDVVFEVQASGTAPLVYQWKKDDVTIPDATNALYAIAGAGPDDEGAYTVEVSNIAGSVTSEPATLTMVCGPVTPAGATVIEGDTVAFTVTMPEDSTGYLYQWNGPGGPIPGATNAVLTLTGVTTAESGSYGVDVTLGPDMVTSDTVSLSVLPVAGDTYSNVVTGDVPVVYWRLGDASNSTVAADEQGLNDGEYWTVGNTGDVAVQLGRPGALLGDVDTSGFFPGTVDSKMQLYDPFDVATPSFTVEFWAMSTGGSGHRSPISNRDIYEGDWSGWMFYATPGNTWQFWTGDGGVIQLDGGPVVLGKWTHVVGSYDAVSQTMSLYVDGVLAASQTNVTYAAQDFNPLWVGSGANETPLGDFYWVGGVDEVAIYDRALDLDEVLNHYVASFGIGTAPVITFDPQFTWARHGEPVSMSVGARGLPLVTYRWQRDGVDVPGANSATLDVPAATASDAGLYRCIVANPHGAVTSAVAELFVLLPLTEGVSVNFWDHRVATAQQLAPTDVAGFFGLANWNHATTLGNEASGTGAQPLLPVDQDGAATTMEVRWSSQDTWRAGATPLDTPDKKLGYGYLDDGDTPFGELDPDNPGDGGAGVGVYITVSSVPYASYVVVLYLSSDQPDGYFGRYEVNGTSQTGGATMDYGEYGGWVENENVLLFVAQTSPTLEIRGASRNGTTRSSLAGFQVLDAASGVAPAPPITAFAVDGEAGTYSLSWDSIPGMVYAVESESDLVNGPWGVESGAGAITATGETTSWSAPATGVHGNYRVVEDPR